MDPVISQSCCDYVYSTLVELVGPLGVTSEELFTFMAAKRQYALAVRRYERAADPPRPRVGKREAAFCEVSFEKYQL